MEVILQFYFPGEWMRQRSGIYFKILGIILSCGWFSSDGGGSTGSDGWRSGIVGTKLWHYSFDTDNSMIRQ